uniref:C2 domain-containing protein n=1 Tax=Ditylenchus dipsaci TaxID=166011 RepID=A0A915CWA1_9BILA
MGSRDDHESGELVDEDTASVLVISDDDSDSTKKKENNKNMAVGKYFSEDNPEKVAPTTSFRNSISMESQLLSVGAGFVVFVALVAFLATLQRRKLRNSNQRSSFKSPLIQHPQLGGSLKSVKSVSSTTGKVGTKNFRPQHYQSPPSSQLQSPHGSDSSGGSPQCTPLTPYSSFSMTAPASRRVSSAASTHQQDTQDSLQQVWTDVNRGTISLQLQYDVVSQALQVTILACHELPEMMGSSSTSENGTLVSNLNPYVKLRILPDNQHRVKTRVLRGTRNPFFDETFTMYGITPANINNYSLYLAVLAFDKYGRDLILGEAVYSLAGEQADFINNNQKLSTTLKLKARQASVDDNAKRGQVLLSMAHNIHSNSINLAVLKMKDLPKDNAIGLMVDPYVKIYMLVNGQKVAKHKTHVKKKTQDPVFNESFSFELTGHRRGSNSPIVTPLQSVAFQLLILNHDGVTRNEVIGQCVLDADSPLLHQIQSAPGQQIAEWHSIQP